MKTGIFAFSLIVFVASAASVAVAEVNTQVSVGKALKKVASALKKKGIAKVPSTSTLTSSSSSTSSSLGLYSGDPTLQSVIGTPPTLTQIAELSTIKELFWSPGVVDAIANDTAEQLQCRQFFSSTIDGDSGGFGSCQMAEDVGHAFQSVLNAETPICYMRNLPTKENLAAGGLILEKGKFPGNDITKVFAPGSKSRMIKVNAKPVGGNGPTESIFIRIPSTTQNDKKKLLYSATIYFCPEGQPGPRGFNTIQVTSKGLAKLTLGNREDPFGGNGKNLLQVQGYLTYESGVVNWDRSRSRSSSLNVVGGGHNFKADISISSEDLISQKLYSTFESKVSKNYSVSRFSGASIDQLAFLEGAFTAVKQQGPLDKSFVGATEYRDTFYAAAPNNSLISQVQSFNIDSDSFFASPPAAEVDTSAYSCNPKVDIEVTMVQGNATLQASLEPCLRRDFDNIEFCRRDSVVQSALVAFPNSCQGPPPR